MQITVQLTMLITYKFKKVTAITEKQIRKRKYEQKRCSFRGFQVNIVKYTFEGNHVSATFSY